MKFMTTNSVSQKKNRSRESGVAVVGNCDFSRPLVDAAELSLVGQMVERVGKSVGEVDETIARLPPLAHHGSHAFVPHWHFAEV